LRVNQHQQTPANFERVFNEVQNTGHNLEHLLRKKVAGICVYVAAKMSSHTVGMLSQQHIGIDVLALEQTPYLSPWTTHIRRRIYFCKKTIPFDIPETQ